MSWESVAPMPELPEPALPADRLLYALAPSDIPAARNMAGRSYDCYSSRDRWRHLAAGLLMACAMTMLAYAAIRIFGGGDFGAWWLLFFPCTMLARGLQHGAGPDPATRWSGWLLAFALVVPLAAGLGKMPESVTGPLPWVIGLALAADAVTGVRRMHVVSGRVVVDMPRGAEPLAIAAVLRDRVEATPTRLTVASGIETYALEGWLVAMARAGVITVRRGMIAPRVVTLTDEGRLWVESWADPIDEAEVIEGPEQRPTASPPS